MKKILLTIALAATLIGCDDERTIAEVTEEVTVVKELCQNSGEVLSFHTTSRTRGKYDPTIIKDVVAKCNDGTTHTKTWEK